MGVKAYSFSISWSRIFPFGKGAVNEEGIAHYNDVINTCLEYNLIPMATLYHWDTPLVLQDTYGGWLSENIVNDFVDYARLMYGRFGDRVKHWFTVNERKSRRLSAISAMLTMLQLLSFAVSTRSHRTTVSTTMAEACCAG
jgi:beta-glucosidase/6-phospho-beta-glucosidase/beta-galactosidase